MKDALGGSAKTSLLICCAPEPSNASTTLSTLRFATRAKKIVNNVKENIELSNDELVKLVANLKRKLAKYEKANGNSNDNSASNGSNNTLLVAETRPIRSYSTDSIISDNSAHSLDLNSNISNGSSSSSSINNIPLLPASLSTSERSYSSISVSSTNNDNNPSTIHIGGRESPIENQMKINDSAFHGLFEQINVLTAAVRDMTSNPNINDFHLDEINQSNNSNSTLNNDSSLNPTNDSSDSIKINEVEEKNELLALEFHTGGGKNRPSAHLNANNNTSNNNNVSSSSVTISENNNNTSIDSSTSAVCNCNLSDDTSTLNHAINCLKHVNTRNQKLHLLSVDLLNRLKKEIQLNYALLNKLNPVINNNSNVSTTAAAAVNNISNNSITNSNSNKNSPDSTSNLFESSSSHTILISLSNELELTNKNIRDNVLQLIESHELLTNNKNLSISTIKSLETEIIQLKAELQMEAETLEQAHIQKRNLTQSHSNQLKLAEEKYQKVYVEKNLLMNEIKELKENLSKKQVNTEGMAKEIQEENNRYKEI